MACGVRGGWERVCGSVWVNRTATVCRRSGVRRLVRWGNISSIVRGGGRVAGVGRGKERRVRKEERRPLKPEVKRSGVR